MSLSTVDGTTFSSLISPYLGWIGPDDDRRKLLKAILGTVDDESFPGGIIPHVRSREMHYYAVANSMDEWRRLVPLLRASIGATITDFTGLTAPFQEDDPVAAVLIDNEYVWGASFTAGRDRYRGIYALDALARLRKLVNESQQVPRVQPRTTGEVIRSFELSLAAYDRISAEEALGFLRDNLRVDAINLRFLEVALLARFKDWVRIRRLDSFESLCHTRRPVRVTLDLVEAVYRAHILPSERNDDPQSALEIFRDLVSPQIGNLFDFCPARITPTVGKAFLLSAATATPPDRVLADRLNAMAQDWPVSESDFFGRLLEFGFPVKKGIPDTTILSPNKLEAQIEALQSDTEAPSLERATAGLIAAMQINSLEAIQAVVGYAEKLHSDDLDTLLSHPFNGPVFERMLEDSGGQNVPRNWTDLIYSLELSPESLSSGFLRSAVSEWRIDEILGSEQDVHDLITAIERVSGTAQERLFDTLPHLVQWLQSDTSWPDGTLRPLYVSICDNLMILLSLRWWREAAGAARELLDGLLELGFERDEYARLLRDMSDALPSDAGNRDFEVLVELAELVASHTAPDPEARQELWGRITAALYPARTRLANHEVALLHELGQSFGVDVTDTFPLLTSSQTEEDVRENLEGRTVVVYSLTESVAQRVSRLLRELYPGVQVELSNDRHGSTRLAHLARSADIFVVCWRSAAHAATEMIDRLRPNNLVTLYPQGKGSSSILRIVDEHLSRRSRQ